MRRPDTFRSPLGLTAALAVLLSVASAAEVPHVPGPPYPPDAFAKGEEGTVNVDVKFDKNGKVDSCRVVDTTASESLTSYTVDYIKSNWSDSGLSGKDVKVPVIYKIPPVNMDPRMNLPPPPYPIGSLQRHEGGTVQLKVTWDNTGHVVRCEVKSSTAPKSLNEWTCRYVVMHWGKASLAGKSADVPITYDAN